MKKYITYSLFALLLSSIALCSCSENLDIQQVYSFDLITMPVPKKIAQGETVEIRCQLIKEGNYNGTQFFIRFFQPDGKGELRLDDGRILLPNDLYPLDRETFRMYYTSHCTDQQVIDVYVESNHGQMVQKTFSWQNDSVKEEPQENADE